MLNFLGLDSAVEFLSESINDRGYLVISCRFARVGIQKRLGSEISPDFEPDKIYKEYRSPDEVFKDSVLEGFRTVVLTDDHPEVLLDAQNTKDHLIGFVSSEVKAVENTHLQCEITIIDKEIIEKIQAGKVELSAGYLYALELVDHADYDYLQTNIIPNHIAIVDAGRCGSSCSIGMDSNLKQEIKKMKITFYGTNAKGEKIELSSVDVPEDQSEAMQAVADATYANSQSLSDALVKNAKDMDELQAKSDMTPSEDEIKEANDKTIAVKAFDLAHVMVVAKDALGDTACFKGKDAETIKRQVLTKHKPEMALDGKSPEYIAYAFDALTEQLNEAKDSYETGLGLIPTVIGKDEKPDDLNVALDAFTKKIGGE